MFDKFDEVIETYNDQLIMAAINTIITTVKLLLCLLQATKR